MQHSGLPSGLQAGPLVRVGCMQCDMRWRLSEAHSRRDRQARRMRKELRHHRADAAMRHRCLPRRLPDGRLDVSSSCNTQPML